jgi:hypothetical protein
MKVLISMLMLIAVSAIVPDDCSNYIKTYEYKESGKKYTVGKEPIIISDDDMYGMCINSMQGQKSIILNITATAVGISKCIEEGAEVIFLFTDGTRTTVKTDNDFNCKSDATIYFLDIFGKENQYELLTTKDVDIIRVYKSSGYVEKKLSKEQAKSFRNQLKCIKTW